MGSSNNRQTRAQLQRQRSGQLAEGSPMAYAGPGDVVVDVPGDEESAWLKTPPFTEEPARWVQAMPLPVADYSATPAVAVASARLLIVYFELVWPLAPNPTAQLSIIPEKLANGQWYTTGVVDPTVTLVDPTGGSFGNGFGRRTWAPAELLTPLFTGGPRTVRSVLTFDVSDATEFRLQVLQNVAAQTASTLSLFYGRSQ